MADEKHRLARLTFLLLQLAVWAQLGVVTRYFVDKFFVIGCDAGWGPCLAGGIFSSYLPANMLGSFVIGVFAASSTLGLQNDKAMAVLPASHPWQRNFELQIGIRTGYCGSLTTFSSWLVELMTNAIVDNAWMNAVGGLIVGLQAALVSYAIGMHSALYIDRWLLKEQSEDVLMEQELYRESELQRFFSGQRALEKLSPQQLELQQMEPDIPRVVAEHIPMPRQQQSAGTSVDGGANGEEVAAAGPVAEADGDAARRAALEERRVRKTDLAAAALLVALTVGLSAGTAFETQHAWIRQIWVAALLAPIGCTLRWFLSRYNYQLPGVWSWFPGGTFLANMLGTAVGFGLQCVSQRAGVGYWGTLLIGATQGGFCGALTTVSTLVTEIVKFLEVFPDSSHAYTYTAATFGGAIVLALCVFGWAAWAD